MTAYETDDVAWHTDARCLTEPQSPDFFFPPRGGNLDVARVKAFCTFCPVRAECLDYALRHCIKHGVWGGYSERDRRPMRTERNRLARLTSTT